MYDITITLRNGREIEVKDCLEETVLRLVDVWTDRVKGSSNGVHGFMNRWVLLDDITDIKQREHLRDRLERTKAEREEYDSDYLIQDGHTVPSLIEKQYPVVLGHERNKIAVHRFKTIEAAEHFIGEIAKDDPAGVDKGEYYIDAPEEMINGGK